MKYLRQVEQRGVEAELRRYRPKPRSAFLAALTGDLHERMRRPRIVRRAALVTALTVGMLTMFATFGGIGYASSAASSAFNVSKLERLVGISHASHAVKVRGHYRSAKGGTTRSTQATGDNPVFGDQYRPGKGCGDKNHIHLRVNECK